MRFGRVAQDTRSVVVLAIAQPLPPHQHVPHSFAAAALRGKRACAFCAACVAHPAGRGRLKGTPRKRSANNPNTRKYASTCQNGARPKSHTITCLPTSVGRTIGTPPRTSSSGAGSRRSSRAIRNSNAIAPSWHDRLAGYIGWAKVWELRKNSDICYSKGGPM